MQTEEAFAAFLEYQNKYRKAKHVARNPEHVAHKWCWKDWMILI
jgi:hypothetical protein